MSAVELNEWALFHRERPFGPQWDDMRTAHQTANLVQIHSKNRLKVADFLPLRDKTRSKNDSLIPAVHMAFAQAAGAPVTEPDNEARMQRFRALQAAQAVSRG